MDSTPNNPKLSFIQRYHILLKTHYFLFFSAFGVIFPILSLILRSHGLSNTEISISNIFLPFSVFLTSPLIGFIADKTRRYLLTFNILLIIVTITVTGIFFLPYIKSRHIIGNLHYEKQSEYMLDFCASQEVATKCSSRVECGCSYRAFCKKDDLKFNFIFTMNNYSVKHDLHESERSICDIKYHVPIEKTLLNETLDIQQSVNVKCHIICSIPYFCHGSRYPKQMMYIIFYPILYVLGTNLLSIGNVIGASIGFASLSRADLFGKQRVWGTVGFGITAFAASRIYEYFHSEYVYIIMFDIIAILTIMITSFVPIRPVEMTDNNKKKQKFDLSILISLLKKVDVLVFLSTTFVWGMSFGCMFPYLGLYIDEIAPCHSRSIIGWMLLVSSISEVIAFYFARRVIKFCGINLSSILIFLAFALRFFGYYFIRKPYWYLPVETMHFFNFGILYVLIAERADTIAPPGLSGTLQGIAHGITHGLGRGVGLLVSSVIYIFIEERLLFLVFGILNMIAAIIYSIYFLLSKKSAGKNMTLSSTNNNVVLEKDEEPLPSIPMITIQDEQ
ncbi:unnamed protein product [Adineta steineri]|uniref:Major facilitator superfamily associated domain-containing protein n=1 Tax=Adineta steineri TaxID=433720 RepID=A0A814ZA10_9BILA|nr:unnamed protein product [Adineta steineri]CAF3588061.1 unnamed protein product [Adineta steineri]